MRVPDGVDATDASEYSAERADPTFRELPEPLETEPPGAGGREVRR